MKLPWTELRFLVTLRRMAVAMEEANRLEKFRQEREYPPLRTTPIPPRKVVISHPKIDDWNRSHGEKLAGEITNP